MISRLLSLIERWGARLQGKGWGTATIAKEIDVVSRFLKEPRLAIDIGGNAGDYTAQLRNKFVNLEVHLFEPSSANFNGLVYRFKEDSQVVLNKKAVANYHGAGELFSNAPGSGLASLTKRKLDHFQIDFNITERIEAVRFEDYWMSVLLKCPVDFIKIDVEGHELDVLKGMGASIFQTKVIQFEFGGCNIDTRTYFQDFWYFFKAHFFDIYRITPMGAQPIKYYRESDEFFSTTNFVCVNRNLL